MINSRTFRFRAAVDDMFCIKDDLDRLRCITESDFHTIERLQHRLERLRDNYA